MSKIGLPYIRPSETPQTVDQLQEYRTAPPLQNSNDPGQNNDPDTWASQQLEFFANQSKETNWVLVGVGLLVLWKILS